jgi:hypothetical protein
MTTRGRPRRTSANTEAIVWIDHDQALILDRDEGQSERVELVSRGPAESEATFRQRAVEEVVDEDRVVVTGPAFARTTFERAYVALTHRPDRLVDVEPRSRRRRG